MVAVRLALVSKDPAPFTISARSIQRECPEMFQVMKAHYSQKRFNCIYMEDERVGTFIIRWGNLVSLNPELIFESARQWKLIADAHDLKEVRIPRFADSTVPMDQVQAILQGHFDERFKLVKEDADEDE